MWSTNACPSVLVLPSWPAPAKAFHAWEGRPDRGHKACQEAHGHTNHMLHGNTISRRTHSITSLAEHALSQHTLRKRTHSMREHAVIARILYSNTFSHISTKNKKLSPAVPGGRLNPAPASAAHLATMYLEARQTDTYTRALVCVSACVCACAGPQKSR